MSRMSSTLRSTTEWRERERERKREREREKQGETLNGIMFNMYILSIFLFDGKKRKVQT